MKWDAKIPWQLVGIAVVSYLVTTWLLRGAQ